MTSCLTLAAICTLARMKMGISTAASASGEPSASLSGLLFSCCATCNYNLRLGGGGERSGWGRGAPLEAPGRANSGRFQPCRGRIPFGRAAWLGTGPNGQALDGRAAFAAPGLAHSPRGFVQRSAARPTMKDRQAPAPREIGNGCRFDRSRVWRAIASDRATVEIVGDGRMQPSLSHDTCSECVKFQAASWARLIDLVSWASTLSNARLSGFATSTRPGIAAADAGRRTRL
jgi:hypothetical protein